MSEPSIGIDDKVHKLVLGESFLTGKSAYHAVRYDFKPASVDTNQVADVEIGSGNQVTVTVPHVEGSGTSHTVYKGNKRPSHKECILIIDHETGEIRLEKLDSNLQLKKTRFEGSKKASQVVRPTTHSDNIKEQRTSPSKQIPVVPKPTSKTKKEDVAKRKPSPVPTKPQTVLKPEMTNPSKPQHPGNVPQHPGNVPQQPGNVPQHHANVPQHPGNVDDSGSDDSSSSSSSSDSDSDSEPETKPPAAPPAAAPAPPAGSETWFMNTLSADLQLSESGSDSD